MSQNIYDNPDFFAGYAQLRRSKQGLDGAPEWPALQRMLPALRDMSIADLGCGYGWFCRKARDLGAARIIGIDLSEKMLAKARAMTPSVSPSGSPDNSPGGSPDGLPDASHRCSTNDIKGDIKGSTKGGTPDDGSKTGTIIYRSGDLERLDLPQASFNLVYSSLTLHYIENISCLLQTVHDSLLSGGHFIFSAEHPIYTAPLHPGWIIGEDGQKAWPVNNYQRESARSTDWLVNGVIKQHRTIGTYLNLLIKQGFKITHVEEWKPSDEQIADAPELAEERERPMLLLVSAQK